MSQTFEMDDDLCPEYDFTKLPVVAQVKGASELPGRFS
jgi:hypothetical protein